MSHDDDAGEDLLAGVDLHAWQVPPPSAAHRPAVLVRALSAPTRRQRLVWMLGAAAVVNAAAIAILLIIISRPSPTPTPTSLPAGGSMDATVQELIRKIQEKDREIAQRRAELAEIQKRADELARLVREFEQREAQLEELDHEINNLKKRRDKTVSKQPKTTPKDPDIIDRPLPERVPQDPYSDRNRPVTGGSCDEVSCVLGNYEGTCCAAYRKGGVRPSRPAANQLPESLDRTNISTAIAKVKDRVIACGAAFPDARGKVKVSVRVSAAGQVVNLTVDATPDPALGGCVADAVGRATFAPTQLGGSFSYPFVF